MLHDSVCIDGEGLSCSGSKPFGSVIHHQSTRRKEHSDDKDKKYMGILHLFYKVCIFFYKKYVHTIR